MPETYKGHEIRLIWEGRYYTAEVNDGQYMTVAISRERALAMAKDLVDTLPQSV